MKTYVNISKGFIILYLMNMETLRNVFYVAFNMETLRNVFYVAFNMETLRNVFYVAFNYSICTKYNVDK